MILGNHQMHVVKHPVVRRNLPRESRKRIPLALELETRKRPIDNREIDSGFLA